MEPRVRKITLIVLAVLIVIVISFGVTKAFMKPVEQGGNLTEIALSSCAKIKLTGTSSINLSNSYPMSRNRGLQTTPYSLTITSYCDSYVGFNLYIATLSSNTLEASKIHYILTDKGSKDAIVEGVLSTADNGVADFSDTEKTELNTGLKGTYGSIYKIYNANIALKGNKQYDLYLFVDEAVTNDTMGQTFKAGVAVKAYDREKDKTLAEYVIEQYGGVQGNNNIYHHDGTLENGINDGSYRYSGASEDVNNYVCFGTSESPCPTDNLYRIIGVINGEVKIVKSSKVGTFANTRAWDYEFANGESDFYKLLNTTFINELSEKWTNMISLHNWISSNLEISSSSLVSNNLEKYNVIFLAPELGAEPKEVSWHTAKKWFDAENECEHNLSMKIGTVSISELRYSTVSSNWNNSDIDFTGWGFYSISSEIIYLGDPSPYIIPTSGSLVTYINGGGDVRPTFYLNSDVIYSSGDGIMNNPIILGD